VEYSDLRNDIKVCEFVGFLLVAERIALWRFGLILPSGVFIEDLESVNIRLANLSI